MHPDKDDMEYVDFLKQLISGKRLEGASLGIATQAVVKGPDTLTENQTAVLEIAIKEIVSVKCDSCHNDIPWCEMYQAIDSGRCLACIPK
jgi:hypothetical protein